MSASPSGDQGSSTTYSNSFTYGVSGQVSVNGKGPQAGVGVSASWQQSVSTTVPAMVVEAGDIGPSDVGAYTKYAYCTEDDATAGNCSSMIQMEKGPTYVKTTSWGIRKTGKNPAVNCPVLSKPRLGKSRRGPTATLHPSTLWLTGMLS